MNIKSIIFHSSKMSETLLAIPHKDAKFTIAHRMQYQLSSDQISELQYHVSFENKRF